MDKFFNQKPNEEIIFPSKEKVIKIKKIMDDNKFYKKFNNDYNKSLTKTLTLLEENVTNKREFIQETGIHPFKNKFKGVEAEYGNYDKKLKSYIKKNNLYR